MLSDVPNTWNLMILSGIKFHRKTYGINRKSLHYKYYFVDISMNEAISHTRHLCIKFRVVVSITKCVNRTFNYVKLKESSII